ncbi:PREDICTED: chondroadherin-like protein [Priapulus caudatus]|uniref:Chondroadherin-like protein n=1 Tax=Priapulus caudatus TaxID=37621 RepID=A0ABM1DT53_PRICU|nr:PREDICTED: chondroadherin-like protein [Priapulus caudatus]
MTPRRRQAADCTVVVAARLLAYIAVTTLVGRADACPDGCYCIVRRNQLVADCSSAGYADVPETLPATTLVLRMDNNSLSTLGSLTLRTVVPNLQELSLSGSGLTSLHADALVGLRNLAVLDVANNRLSAVPTVTLGGAAQLRKLDLSGNPLHDIGDAAFSALSHLTELDLSACRLEHVHDTTFVGLSALRVLRLADNRIRRLDAVCFRPLTSLMQLELSGNPLHCDCVMRDTFAWVRRRWIGHAASPVCVAPDALRGSSWENMTEARFACPPTSVLELRGPRRRHVGEYTCVAANAAGSVNASVLVDAGVGGAAPRRPRAFALPAGLAAVIIVCSFGVVVLFVVCVVGYLFRRRRTLVTKGRRRRQAKNRVKVELYAGSAAERHTKDTDAIVIMLDRGSRSSASPRSSLASSRRSPVLGSGHHDYEHIFPPLGGLRETDLDSPRTRTAGYPPVALPLNCTETNL